jgi:cytochrome c oxidase subunit 3
MNKKDAFRGVSPDIQEKTRKNLVYVGILSIVMMFAGFTSAYIVSMGDSFWLKYPLPNEFYISTALIALSSITLVVGIAVLKKGQLLLSKIMVISTFFLGIGFVIFQFKAYRQLSEKGANAFNNHILVTDGRYGDYYEVKYKGDFIQVDGNDFLINGRKMTKQELKNYQQFMKPFLEVNHKKPLSLTDVNPDFTLYYNNEPLRIVNQRLVKPDSTALTYVDEIRLSDLAKHVRDERGDFFHRGIFGKDFNIFFKGKKLTYKNRELQFNGRKLSRYLQIKAMETADTATSYLYIITFLHLLHVAVTLIFMLRLSILSLSGRFTPEDNLGLRVGAIFWHFLGLLWLYLLLFLLFIH